MMCYRRIACGLTHPRLSGALGTPSSCSGPKHGADRFIRPLTTYYSARPDMEIALDPYHAWGARCGYDRLTDKEWERRSIWVVTAVDRRDARNDEELSEQEGGQSQEGKETLIGAVRPRLNTPQHVIRTSLSVEFRANGQLARLAGYPVANSTHRLPHNSVPCYPWRFRQFHLSFANLEYLEILGGFTGSVAEQRSITVPEEWEAPLFPHLQTLRLADVGFSPNGLAFIQSFSRGITALQLVYTTGNRCLLQQHASRLKRLTGCPIRIASRYSSQCGLLLTHVGVYRTLLPRGVLHSPSTHRLKSGGSVMESRALMDGTAGNGFYIDEYDARRKDFEYVEPPKEPESWCWALEWDRPWNWDDDQRRLEETAEALTDNVLNFVRGSAFRLGPLLISISDAEALQAFKNPDLYHIALLLLGFFVLLKSRLTNSLWSSRGKLKFGT
ncbi:hypothetical protein DFH06DRAFT_1142825 [Mycena polygramma]|nr:hypothetical protein DFH06DRAFT_1142825 [Mycena polygramma]